MIGDDSDDEDDDMELFAANPANEGNEGIIGITGNLDITPKFWIGFASPILFLRELAL